MKLSFDKSALLNGINIVLKAVPSKTTMSILECILIDASFNEIKLTANDMELGIETVVDGSILERGRIAIEAKLFSEIVRRLPDSEVIIESDADNYVSITCEKADFKIPGKDADEFSYLPMLDRDEHISLSQFTLKEMIRQTIFSIAAGDVNKLMTGELLEVNENEFKLTSLDGHRISIRKVLLKDSYASKKVVVPGKTLTEVSKILSGDTDKEVMIFFGANHILFEFDRTIVLSRLIEGEYFRVQQMLSGDYETKIEVNKKDFLESIERAVLLVRENDKKPIILNLQDQSLEMSLTSMMGKMKEDLLVHKQGKDIMNDETVSIYMVNSKAPCFIRDEEENYIYLILPVNFSRA